MARKAEKVESKRMQFNNRWMACSMIVVCSWMGAQSAVRQALQTQAVQSQAVQSEAAFSKDDAMTLLRQIEAGLASHNPRKMLNAFDLAQMSDGRAFQQDTLSFFDLTGTIRVHYNLLQTEMDGARGVADVSMEMEAESRDDRLPPVHKHAQMHLVFAKSGDSWRIVDIRPRDFFSTQP